jgi:hypothetical protein
VGAHNIFDNACVSRNFPLDPVAVLPASVRNGNLIMPEPCPFISASLPPCSVVRPTKTAGAAMGALNFLTAMGLFIGQSNAFFSYMTALAQRGM